MRSRLASTIGCVLLLCAPFVSLAQQKPLTNADVINMAKGGLAESIIISAIQLNPANYDVSPTALLALKKAGVTSKEQDAMLAAIKAASAPAAAPAPHPLPPQPPESPANAVSAANPQGWRMPSVSVMQGPASQPTKKFSGGDVSRGQGDGFAFDAVWPFQIAMAQ